MVDKIYKVAVAALGKRGMHHATAVKNNPRLELVCVCDIDEARVEAAKAQLGASYGCNDSARMLADTKPDVFIFCTLPQLRLPMIKAGVDAGVKLIAYEKPIAMSMNEALEIFKLTRAAGVKTAQQSPALGIGQVAISPAKERLDATHQLAQPERLGDVVVRAKLQADDLVHLFVAGGQHQDRRLGAARAEATEYLEAVDTGQSNIKDHEIRRLAKGKLKPLLAGTGHSDLIALLLEGVLDSPRDGVFILDDQDSGSHRAILHLRRGADSAGRASADSTQIHAARCAANRPAVCAIGCCPNIPAPSFPW